MADNANNRKKTLIIGVLAFLFIGGGIFLFFVIQGSNDLTGAGKKNAFTYGNVAREAATSFFKFVGFDDVESIAKEGDKDRLRLKEYAAAGLLDSADAPQAPQEDVPWAPPAASGKPSAPANIPKMSGGGTSGVGGMGGGGTRSSGGASRFADGSGAGNTKISAKVQEGADGVKGTGSLASLAKTRVMLGDGLRSGSAATAKGKWDSSFGVGRSGGGAGSDLAYAKSGLVNLDKIKKGEVDNLKTTDPKSLKTPEVGAPKKDEKADEADPVLKKAKEAAEDAITKSMASSMAGALGQGLTNSTSRGGSGDNPSAGGVTAPETGSCPVGGGGGGGVCSVTSGHQIPSDSKVNYTQVGSTAEGKIFEVSYAGSGPGVTPGMKGTSVNYTDTCIVLVKPDGTSKITGWGVINESPVTP
ncbi:MAG: hypothetical protein NDI60_00470 [Elusimicrobiales bacterium]|nr:hypothetical protein [Elusimicrobiales bacterium]